MVVSGAGWFARKMSGIFLLFVAANVALAEVPHVSPASQGFGAVRSKDNSFVVRVRSVLAEQPHQSRGGLSTDPSRIIVDSELLDIKSKLAKYGYHRFRLLDSEERLVEENTVELIGLSEGHSITVRPVSLPHDRIGLWLRWRDAKGIEVLNTKLKFDSQESMLAGVEGEGRSGRVLAIGVVPAR